MNALAEDARALPSKLFTNRIPERLKPTDRVLLRWAASVGDCIQDEPAWQELLRANVSPLPDDVAIVVDQLILRAPKGYRKIVELWYRKPDPREVIASKLHVTEDQVYICWHVALGHFRGYFENSPLSSLKSLVGIDVDSRLRFVRGLLSKGPRVTS